MSMEHKLLLDRWKESGWKIVISGGEIYATKGEIQLFVGLVKNL